MKFKERNAKFKVVIAGAGPAGASLAIRLARENFRVVLIEREKFPRHKLCGEFISPECLAHFRELDVLDEMLDAGGERIADTFFYEPGGKRICVSSEWFGGASQSALSLSRAEMDLRLLQRARQAGVEIFEATSVTNVLIDGATAAAARGVTIKQPDKSETEIDADLIIDATGRTGVLSKLVEREFARKADSDCKKREKPRRAALKNKLVGFKAHLKNVRIERGVCEIYIFKGGYGGLSFVENDLANHCFLIKAETVRKFSGDVEAITEKVIFRNKRACQTLREAVPATDWLSVAIDGFGAKELSPVEKLLTIGDAAAFIDPFTGSGMLMALESAKIMARCIIENSGSSARLRAAYEATHKREFQKRLYVCSLLRRAAFMPNLAKIVISSLEYSARARRHLARATRQSLQ